MDRTTEASPSTASDPRRFFFVHVMKTGGTTLYYQALRHFGADHVFPSARLDRGEMQSAYSSLEYLRALPDERLEPVLCFMGHHPWFVGQELVQRLGQPLIMFTVLRDPVERTVSLLKHARSFNAQMATMTVEEIYEEPRYHRMFIRNFQLRSFATSADDDRDTIFHYVDADRERLTLAKERLASVDLVGFHERYDEFLAALSKRYGWTFGEIPSQRVSDAEPLPDTLRDRIRQDNLLDVEFYDYARARFLPAD